MCTRKGKRTSERGVEGEKERMSELVREERVMARREGEGGREEEFERERERRREREREAMYV